MSILKPIKKLFAPLINSFKGRNNQANFYDGGRFTRANRDFINANSDFETTASGDRDTLRARARWLHENNPILSNIDNAIADYTIGSGIKFQLKTQSEDLNKEIEQSWDWGKDELDITGRDEFSHICNVALKQRLMDGEIAFYLPFIKEFGVPKLRLQAIEVDRFALGNLQTKEGMFFDGIETNAYGRPIRYHFENDLFRQANISNHKVQSSVSLKAEDVLYYYKRDNRFSQYRGISEYKQVIIDLKNFSAYIRATIESARSRANIAYILKQENLDNRFKLDKVTNDPMIEINGIFVKRLRENEKLEILDPKNTNDTYKDFISSVIRLIATGRKVSYELAFRDYSTVNYSSARMSLLQDYKIFDKEFSHFSNYFYIPIFMRWLEIECMKGAFKNLTYSQFLHQKQHIQKSIKLYPPRRDWVDPYKDANADALMLENCTSTLEQIYARRGEDYEDALKQIAKEQELMKKLGIQTQKTIPINKDIKDE